MGRIIKWNAASQIDDDTDYLFYAEDVIRHKQFRSTLSVKYCLSDALRYVVGNEGIVVPPSALYITNAGQDMECLPCNPGIRALTVSFSNDLVQDVYRNHVRADKNLLDDPEPPSQPIRVFQHVHHGSSPLAGHLHALALRMAASGDSNDLPFDVLYRLAEGLLALQSDMSRQMNRMNARTPATREELYRRLLQAKEFMHDHWQNDLTIKHVARHVCLSPYHFHRNFREAFGLAPMRWFRQLKLQNAKAILATKCQSVSEVALHCGFADVFSFSKAFKRECGVRPSVVWSEG